LHTQRRNILNLSCKGLNNVFFRYMWCS